MSGNADDGVDRCSSTVLALTTPTDFTMGISSAMVIFGLPLRTSSRFSFTAWALKASPLVNFTPVRRCRVSVKAVGGKRPRLHEPRLRGLGLRIKREQ